MIKISAFEKLKIRPVNVCDLKTDQKWSDIWADPKEMNWNDLFVGDVVRTAGESTPEIPNIWILFDIEGMRKLFGNGYSYPSWGFVRPEFVRPELEQRINANFNWLKSYYENWPKYITPSHTFDIVDVWKTRFDISDIKSAKDLVDFYNKHNLFDL